MGLNMKNLSFIFALFVAIVGKVHALDLKVNITNIHKKQGFIRLAMYDNAKDFPSNYVNAIETQNILVTASSATATITNLKAGTYAIAIFQDENNDENLNTNALGIPKEPFGFSNNPRLLGPPTFSKCKITVTQNQTITIELKRF
jgi:uncharacterized protein (DUF2141 family)